MCLFLVAALTVAPCFAFADGSDDKLPPKPTETTTTCIKAMVWDEKQQKCISPQDGALNDDTRFRAVRELAYAGRSEEALIVLEAMTEGDSDRVLTYKGFAHRKSGRPDLGMDYYARALDLNPDNIVARSYLGQMLVEMGEIAAARRQLDQIRARGGAGTHAEASLAQSVGSGQTLSY
ncbi:MAG: tetratricopeptide repeat protein [Rhodobacteraceae bacterium]|nr:tetratricopeptide repeat protein [Paracoccaceae bacterium]MCF8515899.1 tetratricopeptide repeat protein [Paracoccaceae bacterium]MCF8520132.1 tetratricopeptide repeat protein [Paracoccaceae bacterium]